MSVLARNLQVKCHCPFVEAQLLSRPGGIYIIWKSSLLILPAGNPVIHHGEPFVFAARVHKNMFASCSYLGFFFFLRDT